MVDGSMGMERSSGAALEEMAVELAAAGPLRLRPSLVDFSGLSRSQLPRRLMMGMKGIAGVSSRLYFLHVHDLYVVINSAALTSSSSSPHNEMV
jgi:hypothetical protein